MAVLLRGILCVGIVSFWLGAFGFSAAEAADSSRAAVSPISKVEPQKLSGQKTKVILDDLMGKGTGLVKNDSVPGAVKSMGMPAASSLNSDPGVQNFMKTVSVDTRGGGAAVSVPLRIPEGRGGVSPFLGLSWHPAGGYGPLGWGWSLEMGEIVRSLKNGVPGYQDGDSFLASFGGKAYELISLGVGGEYRSRLDDDRTRFFFNNGVWHVKDRSGMTYYFGSRPGATVSDGGSRIFKWKLDRVEDLHGNVLVVDYFQDGGFEVRYGLMAGKNPAADVNSKVNFAYVVSARVQASERPDALIDYKPGFAVSEKRLIESLSVTGGGNLIRRYDFSYAASLKTGRSLLRGVTEVGADGKTTRPVVNLGYSDGEDGVYEVKSIADPVQGDNLWTCTPGILKENSYIYGPSVTQSSASQWGISWEINPRGNLTARGPYNGSVTCQSYIYLNSDREINFYATANNPENTLSNSIQVDGTAICGLNFRCASPVQDISAVRNEAVYSFRLKKGYHLLKSTATSSYMCLGSCRYGPFSFSLNTDIADQVDLMNSSQVLLPQLVGDFNGDGRADVATFFPDTGTVKVSVSDGREFLPKTTWIEGLVKGGRLYLGDFNGDGRTDIAVYDPVTAEVRVAVSDGTRFHDSCTWFSNVPSGADLYPGDFNGDGRTDFYLMTKTSAGQRLQVVSSSGSDFLMGRSEGTLAVSPQSVMISGDLNGDGLTDLVSVERTAGTWSVYLNRNGFDGNPYFSVSGFGGNKVPIVSDFNQDGRADLGYFDPAARRVVYRPSVINGVSAERVIALELSFVDPLNTQLQSADFNGDGLLDFMAFDNAGHSDIVLSKGSFCDLVTRYDNGFGGKIEITYGSSVDLPNRYLPFSFPVVTSVTAVNGHGDRFATSYSYSSGYWNPSEREMYGFGESRVIDADGNYAVSEFHQDNMFLRGRLARTALHDRQGKIYEETRFQWNNDPIVPGRTDVRGVSLKRSDRLLYDASSPSPVHVRTAIEYSHDNALGLPTEIRDYGKVDWETGADVSDDYIRTVMTYGSNPANYILGVLVSKVSYDQNNNLLGKTHFYYDGLYVPGKLTRGLLTRREEWNRTGPSESLVTEERSFNAFGQLVSRTDALGHVTTMAYDPVWSMFLLTTTNPKGFRKTDAYYGIGGESLSGGLWGALKRVGDINDQQVTTTYDALGRVTAEIGPLDSLSYPTVVYEYLAREDHRVRVTRKRVEHGQAATLDSYAYFDGLGRVLMLKTPSAYSGKYVVSGLVTMNSRGLVAKEYPAYFSGKDYSVLEFPDRAAWGTSYEYDLRGRCVRTVSPDGNYSDLVYAPLSLTVIDPNGHKSVSVLDARGRVVRVENYSGATGQAGFYPRKAFSLYAATRYVYGLLGDLLSVTDSKGNVMGMTYDALGRKITMNDPDMHNLAYKYDPLGQLVAQSDARNTVMTFDYDALGRVLNKSQLGVKEARVGYVYDAGNAYAKGRLTRVEYPSGMADFSYDAAGRQISVVKTIRGEAYATARSYDALGRVKSLVYPDGKTSVVYGYNAAGQMDTVTLRTEGGGAPLLRPVVTGTEYTANGSIQKINYGNGASEMYLYDPVTLRLMRHMVVNSQNAAQMYNVYTYDPVGNVVYIDNNKGYAREYVYDFLNRMIAFKDGKEPVVSFRYDELGNMVQKGDLIYTYGKRGAGPHAVMMISDGSSMSYDSNGNMLSYRCQGKAYYYSYDPSNRLIRVDLADATVGGRYTVAEYLYDGDGGRTSKMVYARKDAGIIPVRTNYVGDLAEETPGGVTNFLFLGNRRIASYDGNNIRWFAGDHLGSVSMVLDEMSAVKERIVYSPWGEIKSFDKYGEAPEIAWFYFTGKRFDEEAGLYYFGARYYNPKIGRFLTPDIVVQDPMNPQTLNRYTYCNNNPASLSDPTGHRWKWSSFVRSCLGAVVGAVVTVATGGWGAPVAFALGGMTAGAVSGGLSGGWQGALWGGAAGGVLGGLIGGGISLWGQGFGTAAFMAGGGYAVSQGHADVFLGAVAGGIVGTGIGSYFFDGISKTTSAPGRYQRWDIRGVGTTEEEAMAVAEHNQSAAFSVRSRGVLSDFVRAGMEKIFGPGRAARELAFYTAGADGRALYAHSEGTMLLAQAMKVNISDGIRLPNATFDFNAPVVMRSTAQSLASQLGASQFSYNLNMFDPIGVFTTVNPFQIAVYGITGIVTAFHFHSGTTYPSLGI